jgi:hypothetical protein
MYVAARVAMQSPPIPPCAGNASNTRPTPAASFHGRNVIIRALSETCFEADCGDDYPVGALVRVRLPGAGAALARVTGMTEGRLVADFINPVGSTRLAMAIGAR